VSTFLVYCEQFKKKVVGEIISPLVSFPPSTETLIGLSCDKLIEHITLPRADVLNRALKHARQSRNLKITPPSLIIAYCVPYVGE